MLNIILAKTKEDAADAASSLKNCVAIETEYGNQTLGIDHPEVVFSLNHHGKLQTEEAPALAYKKLEAGTRYDNFIISHIDTDVLFGILWAAGWLKFTPITQKLSFLVAQADVNGFHTMDKFLQDTDPYVVDIYLAIGYLVNSWVIKDDGLTKKDVSKEVHKLLLRIKDIILRGATEDQVIKYKQWLKKQHRSAQTHLTTIYNLCEDIHLFVFRAPFSLTTAYKVGDIEAKVIIQYNEQSKSITLSCYDEGVAETYFGSDGVLSPLKEFFGEEAGGKKAIGGSPRGTNLQPEILNAFVEFLIREYFNVPEEIKLEEIKSER